MKSKLYIVLSLVVFAALVTTGITGAAATSKTLSTNFTLLNMGESVATAGISYYKDDGSAWAVSASSSSVTMTANGGQAIIAQYLDSTMTSGKGSAVVSSDQPLGAVVQILARGQTPTQGAYSGSSSTDSTYYVPLAMRLVSGTSSQIIIQNADTASANITIQLVKAGACTACSTWTKTGITITAGASYYYDLSDESSANLVDGWYGSAVVTAASGRKITVVSNLFAGADQLQTFNAFPASSLATSWFVPLFASRLSNQLSTPVAVQNLSGSTITTGTLVLDCLPVMGTAFTATNTSAVANNEAYYFNPVSQTSLPAGFYGSCKVTAPGNVVVFVQMRRPGATPDAAAYEGIRTTGTNTKVLVPLAVKQLSSGFATAITIQNLSNLTATVTMTYTPNSTYVANGGSPNPIVLTNVQIAPNSSLIRNLINATGNDTYEPTMPVGWYGTLVVKSTNGAALDGFVQLKTQGANSGDQLMAHNVFTLP